MISSSHTRIGGTSSWSFRFLVTLVAWLGLSLGQVEAQQVKPNTQPAPDAVAKRPVILLTGFEPFGEDREPNPSWEAIKTLDGKPWNAYQLVCKQAKVVWGAPLEQLGGWISEYHPVAVFSFGAGRDGIFSLETRARNHRTDHEDNLGNKPTDRAMVLQGPGRIEATIDSFKLVDALVEKNYPIYISRDAGQYLCEEALYSLEFLKASRKLSATVVFCHVPPLGSRISREQVSTPAYVRRFVIDMLESWDQQNAKPDSKTTRMRPTKNTSDTLKPRILKVGLEQAAQANNDTARNATEDPRHPAVKKFVEHYFSSWSEQDMDGYDACFLDEACIQFIDARGSIASAGKSRFVASQRAFHRSSATRTVEVPENIDIRFEGKLARAVVYWKLTSGPRIERGYDHFTLMTEDGQWRIVNLVFYGTSSGR